LHTSTRSATTLFRPFERTNPLRTRITRVIAVAAAIAAASVGLIATSASANTAGAAPTGPITLSPSPATTAAQLGALTINPPSGAACAGDTAAGGYRWQTFLTNAADPNVLTFTTAGPTGAGTVNFPLFSSAGSPIVNQATGAVTGILTGFPATYSTNVLSASTVTSGSYFIGFACTVGGVSDRLWFSPVTVVAGAGNLGVASLTFGATPSAPVLTAGATTLTSCSVNIVAPAATPAATAITVTYTPTGTILAGAVVATSALAGNATSDTKTLVTGQTYNITATQTNSVGASAVSNTIVCTPSTVVTSSASASPASLAISLSWTFGGTPTGYSVAAAACAASTTAATCTLAGGTPITGSPFAFAAGVTSNNFTGLTAGQLYIFSVSATYAAGTSAPAAVTVAAANANSLIIQDLFVTRPAGALVLTQRCNVHAGMGAETVKGFGTIAADTDTAGLDPLTHVVAVNNATFPATQSTGPGNAPTSGATTNSNVSGTGAPVLVAGAGNDPLFSQYPYPVDANGVPTATYPTHCGVNLGIGKLITGDGLAGQYFAATGRLNQITVVDTQDDNTKAWSLTGSSSAFTSASDSFSGDYLGWTMQVTNTSGSSGATLAGYKQLVNPGAGAVVDPSTVPVSTGAGVSVLAGAGLGSSRTAATAPGGAVSGAAATGTGPLGIATIDGRLKLLIPVTAKNGIYTATLTFNVI
jgi:hypothetical protein